MRIEKYTGSDIKNWYIATGKYNGRFVCGYGRTHLEAIKDALK